MNRIKKIEGQTKSAMGKRVLGILEGKAGYTVKANFSISTEELLGEDRKFQGLEK